MNLIEQIDHWALAAPNAIAHISGDQRLTYGELRRRSDALAAHLTTHFGDDCSPIAVLGHREPEMLIAFLGAVKSRRPYVPLDTVLPQQRIDMSREYSYDASNTVGNASQVEEIQRSLHDDMVQAILFRLQAAAQHPASAPAAAASVH